MGKQPDKSQQDLEAEVWSAISAFEQILEVMPNDRASLEALSGTYEQIGDHTKAKEYTIRLGNILLEEGDLEAAKDLLGHLKPFADDEAARALITQIEQAAGPKPTMSIPVASVGHSGSTKESPEDGQAGGVETARPSADRGASRVGFSMADELAFAWNLLEAKELSQEEYSSVVQDLTEMSSVDSATTVSVLHVLETRAFKNLERVMGHVSKECGAPIISLASFDLKTETTSLLPPDYMLRRGVMIFETIAKDALVVAMNPYDRQLRKDVESMCGRKCHFFMTLPSEFDKALEGIIKASVEQAGQTKA